MGRVKLPFIMPDKSASSNPAKSLLSMVYEFG
jgi:hypothetical protein